jgi:hypothetical protein
VEDNGREVAAVGFSGVRCGVYASLELAKTAAEYFRRGGEAPKDPENFSFFIEEETVVRKASPELVTEPGRSWRWWPELAEQFAAV